MLWLGRQQFCHSQHIMMLFAIFFVFISSLYAALGPFRDSTNPDKPQPICLASHCAKEMLNCPLDTMCRNALGCMGEQAFALRVPFVHRLFFANFWFPSSVVGHAMPWTWHPTSIFSLHTDLWPIFVSPAALFFFFAKMEA